MRSVTRSAAAWPGAAGTGRLPGSSGGEGRGNGTRRSGSGRRGGTGSAGSRVRLTGALQRVQPGRPGGRPVLQADLGSGSGRVRLVWLGREHIPGIEPGRVLAVEGTLSVQRGRPTIFNPRYDLAAGQLPGGARPR